MGPAQAMHATQAQYCRGRQRTTQASQGVTGFPMMFFYAHSVKTEYTGARSYDQLVVLAEKASSPYTYPLRLLHG